jgi:acyl transferase domain-containing protein
MIAAGLSEAQAVAIVERSLQDNPSDQLVVECINSHRTVTFSRDKNAIDKLKVRLDNDGTFNRKLRVSVAYHSQHMEQIAAAYCDALIDLEAPFETDPTEITMISSVTGQKVNHSELRIAAYWVANMVSPVKFSDALTKSVSRTQQILDILEIGPQAALRSPINDILGAVSKAQHADYYSILERNLDGVNTLFNVLGNLYCLGYPVDVVKVNGSPHVPTQQKVLADLPS